MTPNSETPVPFRRQLALLIEYAEGAPTLTEVAEGVGMSLQGLYYLLDGRNDSPRYHTVRQICAFFGVPVDYFGCETESECLRMLLDARASQPKSVLRAIDRNVERLSDMGRRNLLTMIALLSRAQGKPEKQRS